MIAAIDLVIAILDQDHGQEKAAQARLRESSGCGVLELLLSRLGDARDSREGARYPEALSHNVLCFGCFPVVSRVQHKQNSEQRRHRQIPLGP